MTEEQREILIKEPKVFLKKCFYHEQRIEEKLELIRHYREIAESITAEIKEVTSFSLTPSHKVENCAMEIVCIEEDIKEEVAELRRDRALVQEAIDLLDNIDDTNDKASLKLLMEARYLRHVKWEDIMDILNVSYRWTLKLHGIALQKISEQAMLIHVETR